MGKKRLSPRRQLLHDLLKLLKAAKGFLGCLNVNDRHSLRNKIITVFETKAKEGINLSKASENADLLTQVELWISEVEGEFKKHREVKPRKTDRDKEIVRLHDEKGLSYAEIALRLPAIRPEWKMKEEAVRGAYRRMKTKRPNESVQAAK